MSLYGTVLCGDQENKHVPNQKEKEKEEAKKTTRELCDFEVSERMLAEGCIILALWGVATLVAVDGAYAASYIAANNDRPEGMPSYFADEREKKDYYDRVRQEREMSVRGPALVTTNRNESEWDGYKYEDDKSFQESYAPPPINRSVY